MSITKPAKLTATKIMNGRKLKRNYQHNYAICSAIALLVQIIK